MKKAVYILSGLAVVLAFGFIPAQNSSAAPTNPKGELKGVVHVYYPMPGYDFAKPDNPGNHGGNGGNRGGGGKPVAQCTVTTNDQVTDWGATGWRMPSSGLTYYVDESSMPKGMNPTDFEAAFARSTNTWHQAYSAITWRFGGNTNAKQAKLDGINTIAFGAAKGAIAVTTTWYYTGTGEIAESDMILASNLAWSITQPGTDCGGQAGTYDVQNITTHELGHQVGLEDLYSTADKDLTMYGYGMTTELKKDSLGAGDFAGAQVVAP